MQNYEALLDKYTAKYNPEIITIDDLTTAAARGDLNLVMTFLKAGVNVNDKNETAVGLHVYRKGPPICLHPPCHGQDIALPP